MWSEVARGAASDAGSPGALRDLDSVQVVYCQAWQYDDPPRRLAERLGANPRHRLYSGIGGTTPQVLLGETAQRMLAGEMDLALVVGGEALATRRRLKKRGERPTWSFPPPERRPFPWEAPFHPAEIAHGVFDAWLTFAIFDSALRSRRGTPVVERPEAVGKLLSPLTEVAAANPDAWFRTRRSPADIATPSAENRMIAFPYTKYATAIMDVDMAAGLLMATTEKADALGVPKDRRVYLRGWCYAEDPWYVAERPDMSRSAAMQQASAEALRASGVSLDDISYLDIYSCFASAVELSVEALGIDCDNLDGAGPGERRSITLTGGLAYHGGPGHNYVSHAIGALADALREDPGSYGLVSGVGMHMTKHAFGVWSSVPGSPPRPDLEAVQARASAAGTVPILDNYSGKARVVAYTIAHSHDQGPSWGVLVCDAPAHASGSGLGHPHDRRRIYARVEDPGELAHAESVDLVGTEVLITPGNTAPVSTSLADAATASANIAHLT